MPAARGRKTKVAYVVGTRPEIIRSASVVAALKSDPDVSLRLVHTGQHYDFLMDSVFFKELAIPKPSVNIGIGSGTHAEQTAGMLLHMERYFEREKPDIVGTFGDTNTGLAASVAAVKLQIPVAHLEAGCREWEMDMPEEINRRLMDHCSRVLLAVSDVSVANLERENVPGAIYNVGDPLFDVFRVCRKLGAQSRVWEGLGLKKGEYALLTLHRPANVDDERTFEAILTELASLASVPVVFPVHPRTRKSLKAHKGSLANFKLIDPLSYHEILGMLSGAAFAITDSGGLQKEAFWSRVPCVTVREHTAWVETVDLGVNALTGKDPRGVRRAVGRVAREHDEIRKKFSGLPNPYYKRDCTARSVKLMKKYAREGW
jgi:UDP-N-acetylglucosamine 2-epimerase